MWQAVKSQLLCQLSYAPSELWSEVEAERSRLILRRVLLHASGRHEPESIQYISETHRNARVTQVVAKRPAVC